MTRPVLGGTVSDMRFYINFTLICGQSWTKDFGLSIFDQGEKIYQKRRMVSGVRYFGLDKTDWD